MSRSPWAGTGALRRLRREDDGAALVVVVGSMMVMAMLALTALTYTLSSQRSARYDQDYNAAMAAAQAGIDDFVSRLNGTATYGLQPDCTNPAWKGPTSVANTCGWTATTTAGWQPVQAGATSSRDAFFHYAVDASQKDSQGSVLLTVTGRANGVYRTVQATVGKGGSTDFVYYTDFESADPKNVQAYPSGASVQCGRDGYQTAKYWYQGRSGCKEITFITGDDLQGAVFSNDTVLSSGATFKSFQTADPQCQYAGSTAASWNSNCLRGSSTANFGSKPQYSTPKRLDDNSSAFATNPGCHYVGSTRVIFKADGTMTVWNRKSVNGGAAPAAIGIPGKTPPTCGTLAQLDSAAGATVPVPDEMVIYVATNGSNDPALAANRQCYGGEIGGPSGATLPIGTYSSAYGTTPTSGQSYTYDTNMVETTKYCGKGNLYAEGVLNGRVTISAAESVIATGDLVLAGGLTNSDDMLGLVATNSVEVFHPRQVTKSATRDCLKTSWGSCVQWSGWYWTTSDESELSAWPTRYKEPGAGTYVPASGILIAGSIQTLQRSFLVQKYAVGGDAGTLQVWGSIAQRWRGIVGETNTSKNGYTKLYQYDPRLTFTRPPYFPSWANSEWTLRTSGEVNTPGNLRS